jgi:putative flippase GtrA
VIAVFSRYVAVQIVAYGIDMGVFLLLASGLALHPLAANVVAKLLAGAFAFVVHRRLTFAVHGKGGGRAQLVKYAALLALNIPAASVVLALLLPWVQPAAAAKFLADVLCVAVTFLASRYLVFRVPEPGSRSDVR